MNSRTRKKLVATANRCEGVYNRAGEPSVTFCEKEEQRRERALIFIKNQSKRYKACSDVAEEVGFEPTVPCGITGFQDQLLKPLGHPSNGLSIA